jgi:hypothetical protein
VVVYSEKEGEAAVDGDGVKSPFALAFAGGSRCPAKT